MYMYMGVWRETEAERSSREILSHLNSVTKLSPEFFSFICFTKSPEHPEVLGTGQMLDHLFPRQLVF